MKLSKQQMQALYEARKSRGMVYEGWTHAGVRDALIRKGLIYDRVQYVCGGLGYYLTLEGEAIAAQIRKDENVVPLRRTA